MSENLIIDINASKFEKYEALLPQIESLIAYETSLTANLANVSAALREAFGWWWVGFYLVDGEELVLGPFQGPVACTRIRFGRGVCGTAWKEAKSQLVPDVEKFPGHIACSSASVSEIVIPVIDKNGKVLAVLDVDSERYDVLDETDVHYLEKLVAMVALIFP
ncbi:MAG: GAF domain-containing protein [Paludibacter sp.]|jgi:GAF domain-containing protein|nr:GAF domain-containing protein [Paludibacter sp.]